MFKQSLAAFFLASASVSALAGQFESEVLGISILTADDWSTLPTTVLATINQSASRPSVMHARQIGINLNPEDAGAEILLLQSKAPLGAKEDNPNFLLATEKAWSDRFEQSGKGYLDLMADRVKRLGAPTRFTSQPKELKIGDAVFFCSDAENANVPGIKIKQRYICGFVNNRYLYFVLSYNSEEDEDFRVMMKCVESLRLAHQTK